LEELRNGKEKRRCPRYSLCMKTATKRKKKMSQVLALYEDSDDNGECTNTAAASSLPLSRKGSRDKEESSSDDHPCDEKDPGHKTTTASAEFEVNLELMDEMEVVVSPHKKRRGVMNDE
jgi:hypothetical protein